MDYIRTHIVFTKCVCMIFLKLKLGDRDVKPEKPIEILRRYIDL